MRWAADGSALSFNSADTFVRRATSRGCWRPIMMITTTGQKSVQLAVVILLMILVGNGAVAAGLEPIARDALVYKDGDRVQGKFVAREGDVIVFRTDRFGELRVPAADAEVVMAEKNVEESKAASLSRAPETPAQTQAKAVAQSEEVERLRIWEWFSPWVLTAKVRNYFGPWHGRLAVSTELVSDFVRHSTFAVDGHLQRKWKSDEVQINTRYDYAEANNLVTTDVVKAAGSYRHDFSKGRF